MRCSRPSDTRIRTSRSPIRVTSSGTSGSHCEFATAAKHAENASSSGSSRNDAAEIDARQRAVVARVDVRPAFLSTVRTSAHREASTLPERCDGILVNVRALSRVAKDEGGVGARCFPRRPPDRRRAPCAPHVPSPHPNRPSPDRQRCVRAVLVPIPSHDDTESTTTQRRIPLCAKFSHRQ